MKSTINFMKDMFAALLAIPSMILNLFRTVLSDRTLTLFGASAILTYAGCPEVAVTLLCDITTYSGIVDCIFLAKRLFIKDEGDELEEELEAVIHEAAIKLLTFGHDIKNIFNVVRNWFQKANKEETEAEMINRMQKEAYREVRNMTITMYMRSINILWNRGITNKLAVIIESPLYLLEIISIKLGIIGSLYESWMSNCDDVFTENELKIIFPDEELDLMDRLCDIGLGEIPQMDLVV